MRPKFHPCFSGDSAATRACKEHEGVDYRVEELTQFQLHDGLNERLPYLRGITDPLPICKAIGVDKEDFIEFHKLAINTAKRKLLSKLIDFVGKDGSTFRAI